MQADRRKPGEWLVIPGNRGEFFSAVFFPGCIRFRLGRMQADFGRWFPDLSLPRCLMISFSYLLYIYTSIHSSISTCLHVLPLSLFRSDQLVERNPCTSVRPFVDATNKGRKSSRSIKLQLKSPFVRGGIFLIFDLGFSA